MWDPRAFIEGDIDFAIGLERWVASVVEGDEKQTQRFGGGTKRLNDEKQCETRDWR